MWSNVVNSFTARRVNEKIVDDDDGRSDERTTDDGHSSILKAHQEQSSGEPKAKTVDIG